MLGRDFKTWGSVIRSLCLEARHSEALSLFHHCLKGYEAFKPDHTVLAAIFQVLFCPFGVELCIVMLLNKATFLAMLPIKGCSTCMPSVACFTSASSCLISSVTVILLFGILFCLGFQGLTNVMMM